MIIDSDKAAKLQGELYHQPETYELLMDINRKLDTLIEHFGLTTANAVVGFKFVNNDMIEGQI